MLYNMKDYMKSEILTTSIEGSFNEMDLVTSKTRV